jgi:hypothetical protein
MASKKAQYPIVLDWILGLMAVPWAVQGLREKYFFGLNPPERERERSAIGVKSSGIGSDSIVGVWPSSPELLEVTGLADVDDEFLWDGSCQCFHG